MWDPCTWCRRGQCPECGYSCGCCPPGPSPEVAKPTPPTQAPQPPQPPAATASTSTGESPTPGASLFGKEYSSDVTGDGPEHNEAPADEPEDGDPGDDEEPEETSAPTLRQHFYLRIELRRFELGPRPTISFDWRVYTDTMGMIQDRIHEYNGSTCRYTIILGGRVAPASRNADGDNVTILTGIAGAHKEMLLVAIPIAPPAAAGLAPAADDASSAGSTGSHDSEEELEVEAEAESSDSEPKAETSHGEPSNQAPSTPSGVASDAEQPSPPLPPPSDKNGSNDFSDEEMKAAIENSLRPQDDDPEDIRAAIESSLLPQDDDPDLRAVIAASEREAAAQKNLEDMRANSDDSDFEELIAESTAAAAELSGALARAQQLDRERVTASQQVHCPTGCPARHWNHCDACRAQDRPAQGSCNLCERTCDCPPAPSPKRGHARSSNPKRWCDPCSEPILGVLDKHLATCELLLAQRNARNARERKRLRLESGAPACGTSSSEETQVKQEPASSSSGSTSGEVIDITTADQPNDTRSDGSVVVDYDTEDELYGPPVSSDDDGP